ncbi:MAG: ABC transporter ATP-binding protein [Acutalibacter sp.]|nr:ABC transporter ATP-binding protein [Acutalibacter sp.]
MAYYLKKYRWPVLLGALPTLVVCGGQAGASLATAQLFQAVFEGSLSGMLRWVILLVGIWLGLMAFGVVRDLLQARAIRRLNNGVREDISAALLQMGHQDYHSKSTGEYLSQFTNDVNQIETLAWRPFFQVVEMAATGVFSVLALLTIHWSLVLAALVTAVVMLFVPQLFNKRMERLGTVCSQEQAAATGSWKDLLSGWDVLRFFGRERRFAEGSRQASEQIEKSRFRLAYVKGFVNSGVGCINVFCQVLIIGLVGLLAIWGYTQPGSLAAGGNLCGMFHSALGSIAGLLLSFSSAKPFFEKITLPAEAPTEKEEPAAPIREGISVEGLTFQYEGKPVLEGASFQFKKGGKYALTGPSGCGKSTLLKLLLGWLPGYGGAIRFDGRDARDFTPEQLQKQMSYIEQNVFLFNSTIRDNITLGEEFTSGQMEKALRDSALVGDLAAMPDGLDTVVGEEGGNLSGGQKQRVAIARALIHDRSILLVDEGTSALDQQNADIVERSLLQNPDLTLILVSHHLSPERQAQFSQVYQLGGRL